MSATETRTGRIAELLIELLADDAGRKALVGILADELAQRELTCRGLHVVDERGRERVRLYGSATRGGVEVQSFAGDAVTAIELQATEEQVNGLGDTLGGAGVFLTSNGDVTGRFWNDDRSLRQSGEAFVVLYHDDDPSQNPLPDRSDVVLNTAGVYKARKAAVAS